MYDKDKNLIPSTRCIHNLSNIDCAETGLTPEQFAKYERQQNRKHARELKKLNFDAFDNAPELTQDEIDLLLQQYLS